MRTKIAVVCTNPWEKFLPVISQSNAKKYYEWLREQAVLREENTHCKEKIAMYGDMPNANQDNLFSEEKEEFQILYLQTNQEKLLEKVLNEADFILVGMPQDRKECDRIYLMILPWLEKSMFIWDGRISQGKEFLNKIEREYKLKKAQIVEMNKLPSV